LIIANQNGEVVAKVNGDGTNHWMVGIPEVGRRIAAMSKEAKQMANIPESVKYKCIGLSLSGCEHETTNANLEREMRKEFPDLSENYVVCSDTLGSIFTVSNLGGMVVIAGTGSNAFLRNPNGGKQIFG
jgi:N-acetylglucosamine kinase